MRAKIGKIPLILGVLLFVVGGVGFAVGFLPQNVIPAMGALALIILGGQQFTKRLKTILRY